MEQIVQNRVRFLEREVVHLRTLVAAHNQTLVEAHRILQLAATMLPQQPQQQNDGRGGGGAADQFRRLAVDLANVQRRIPRLLDAQSKAFNTNKQQQQQRGDDDNSENESEDDNELSSDVPSVAFFKKNNKKQQQQQKKPTTRRKTTTDDDISAIQRDLLRCSNSAFEAWCSDTQQSFDEILSRPSAAFDVFRDEPSEDALEGFMEAFEGARDLLCRSVTPGSDVFASPFALAPPNDISNRVAAEMRDILDRVVQSMAVVEDVAEDDEDEQEEPAPQQKPRQQPPPFSTRPPQQQQHQEPPAHFDDEDDGFAGYPNFSRPGVRAAQQQARGTGRRHQQQVPHELSSNPATYSGSALAAARATNLPSDASSNQQYAETASCSSAPDDYGYPQQQQQHYPRSSATSSTSARAAGGSNTAPLTPSRYRPQKNQSDLVTQVMSGGGGAPRSASSMNRGGRGGGGIGGGGSGTATPAMSHASPPSSSSPGQQQNNGGGRLALLQWQLQQLEMQLFAQTQGGGRASGSEAKFYAINKKLQRIRAEILKEQRAEMELVQVQKDVAEVKRVREHDRLQFGR